jgi:hypothetical protein
MADGGSPRELSITPIAPEPVYPVEKTRGFECAARPLRASDFDNYCAIHQDLDPLDYPPEVNTPEILKTELEESAEGKVGDYRVVPFSSNADFTVGFVKYDENDPDISAKDLKGFTYIYPDDNRRSLLVKRYSHPTPTKDRTALEITTGFKSSAHDTTVTPEFIRDSIMQTVLLLRNKYLQSLGAGTPDLSQLMLCAYERTHLDMVKIYQSCGFEIAGTTKFEPNNPDSPWRYCLQLNWDKFAKAYSNITNPPFAPVSSIPTPPIP